MAVCCRPVSPVTVALQVFIVINLCISYVHSRGMSDKMYKDGEKDMMTKDVKDGEAVWNEMECLQQGGVCLPIDECPKGQQANTGLCPSQKTNGVECCYGLSIKEKRCSKHGGICREVCPTKLLLKQATDCPTSQICCALV